jgi:hypothetical protein
MSNFDSTRAHWAHERFKICVAAIRILLIATPSGSFSAAC